MNNEAMYADIVEKDTSVAEYQYKVMGQRGMLRVASYIYPHLRSLQKQGSKYINHNSSGLAFYKLASNQFYIPKKMSKVFAGKPDGYSKLLKLDNEFLRYIDVVDTLGSKKTSQSFDDACLFEYHTDQFTTDIEETYSLERHNSAMNDCVKFYEQLALDNIDRESAIKEILLKCSKDIQHYVGVYDPKKYEFCEDQILLNSSLASRVVAL